MRRNPPTAVLFDVGNVIVRWDPKTLYSKIFTDPFERDQFLATVCTMDWHGETDRGLTFAENIDRLTAVHPGYGEAIAAWWARWPEMFSGPIVQTEDVIEALHRRGVAMYGLTNMSVEAWPGVQAMSPVFSRLIDTVVSGEEGVIKPEAEIFKIAARRAGRRPDELFFIDDNAANIQAAQALGFWTYHFVDAAGLKPALEQCGLL